MIREYRVADLDALLALFHASVHRLGGGDYSGRQLEAWAPAIPDRAAWSERLNSGRTLVFERDGRIAGFARAEADGCIDLLYVHPDCVRQGVGGELLDRLLEWLREQGAEQPVGLGFIYCGEWQSVHIPDPPRQIVPTILLGRSEICPRFPLASLRCPKSDRLLVRLDVRQRHRQTGIRARRFPGTGTPVRRA
ncbi:MAG: GNAT family N-acetyltransferase [Halofilum sp. (in: g-proteobacteria)]|nr:GNAT family N-acetyltransferase [Halofilum sp. (in: g-proteobacteria)]